jgi:hypothetical protein
MPRFLILYVRWVERLNYGIGRLAMFSLFAMMAVLLWGGIENTKFALEYGDRRDHCFA